jgi:type I restriction-modification system DNA methylase subunit
MPLFQATLLKEQIALQQGKIDIAWETFKKYFHNHEIQATIRSHKEEEYKHEFLNQLFVNVLGCTRSFDSPDNFNLRVEQKNEDDQKKADAAVLVEGNVRAVIEIKDTRTINLGGRTQEQAFGYKNHHPNALYVVTSNFEKLRFYIDYAGEHEEWNLFTMDKEKFGSLWICLAWESIQSNRPKLLKTKSIAREEEITKEFYARYKQFKDDLYANLLENNPSKDKRDKLSLFLAAQKILDRVLFILFAEDRGLLDINFTAEFIIKGWEHGKMVFEDYALYDHLKKQFGFLDKGHTNKLRTIFEFNGGLFMPDATLDGLSISDDVLRHHIHELCQYDFNSDIDVNILGHIFEHSLSEIERIKNELLPPNERTLPKDGKRKKDGIFYTPNYITKYIVEQTLGRLCTEKRQELGIDDADYLAEAVSAKRVTTPLADALDNQLMVRLTAYHDYLLSLTICDPACGSGAFLNAAFDFLKEEHKTIDDLAAKINRGCISPPDIDNKILRNNLFGVDLNEESVEITRLALWLHSAKRKQKLCFLQDNIKCGNSLISDPAVAGDNAFDWHKQFPQVFEQGGFDVVIGNPPYVDSELMCKVDPDSRKFLATTYSTAKGNWDLFVPFIERATQLVKNNGMASMIVPNKLIAENYSEHVRSLLSKKCLYAITDYASVRVFEDADVYPCVFALRNSEPAGSVVMTVMQSTDTPLRVNEIPVEVLTADSVWDKYFMPLGTIDLMKKISAHKTLSSYFEVRGAATVAEAYKVKEVVKEINNRHKNYKKLINTGTIDRYVSLWGIVPIQYIKGRYKCPIVRDADIQDMNSNRLEQSARPKIIVAGMSLQIEAYLDDGSSIAGKSTTIILGDHERLKYLVAILNSRLMSFWFSVNFNSMKMGGGYLSIGVNEVSALPIAVSDDESTFIALADRMLSLHAALWEERQRFLETLTDTFTDVKPTGKFQQFDELEFLQFTAELNDKRRVFR